MQQIAYSLLGEQQGKAWVPDDYISFVDLLADERFCGKISPKALTLCT